MKKIRGIGIAGLSLVELIISMAILAVVGTAIGGAMYVSSRSYTRGSSEINVQEEAQVASNLICDWITDATAVNPDGAGGFNDGASTTLVIVHPEGEKLVEVTISQSGDELVYVAKDVTDPSAPEYNSEVGSGTLAKNLKGCVFHSTFGADRNVKISLDFEINERTYRAVTDSTSRSHDFISTGGTSTLGAPSIRFELVSNVGGPHITLEPGQNTAKTVYSFYVVVDNCDPDDLLGSGVTYTAPAGAKTEIVSCNRVAGTNKWKVTVKSYNDAVDDDPYVFSASNVAGTDSKTLAVRIRRVNSCEFATYTIDPSTGKHCWTPASGTTGSANSTYTNTITLNATNWQEETTIVGAHAGVIGENGFDAAPWTYCDPTALDVQFVSYSGGGHHWVHRDSDILSWNIVPGANPTINVTLKNNITESIAVVVTASHAGTITGDGNEPSDPHLGLTTISTNRARVLDGVNLKYLNDDDMFDVIWISAGGDNPFPNVGGGIRRGVPACMVAEWDTNFKNTLIAKIKTATGLTRTQEDIEWNNGSSLKYCTVLKYRPIDPATGLGIGSYQTVVISNITNWDNLWSDYNARRLRDKTSSIFKLDTAYEVEYDFDVYYKQGGTWVKKVTIPQTGSVCAATPYVYDPNPAAGDTANFKNGKYTFDNPLNIGSGTSNYQLGLFVDGVMFNNQQIGWTCEYYDPATGNWITDNDVVVKDGKEWCEGPYTLTHPNYTYNQVRLADGRSYNVGPYNENEPKANNLNTNLQFFDIVPSEMVSGRLYRVRFVTDWKEYTTISPGVQGGGSDDIVKVSNEVTNHYTLNGDFYFKK